MDVLTQVAQLILILSIIVILHEGGHYAAAKLFKTKVERFFLFFDVKFALFKTKIGETVYGIGWLPLGGYVKIAGMIDESMDTEQMKQPAQPWEFRSKPAWQRLIIMLAGIIVNLVLAFVIFTVLSYNKGESYVNVDKLEYGVVVDSAQRDLGMIPGDVPIAVNGIAYKSLNEISKRALIDGGTLSVRRNGTTKDLEITNQTLANMLELKGRFLVPNLPAKIADVEGVAKESGIQSGDEILNINNEAINGWNDVVKNIQSNVGKDLNLTVKRNDQTIPIHVQVPQEGRIGIAVDPTTLKGITNERTFSFGESLVRGFNLTFSTITDQVQSFGVLWKLKGAASKYVSGPIGIANQLPKTWDWTFFWSFTALFSAWLAFVNILPIPGLDGGHAVFTIYEMITGRKPGDKFMEIAQVIGVVFLFGTMILIFGNDIYNLIYG